MLMPFTVAPLPGAVWFSRRRTSSGPAASSSASQAAVCASATNGIMRPVAPLLNRWWPDKVDYVLARAAPRLTYHNAQGPQRDAIGRLLNVCLKWRALRSYLEAKRLGRVGSTRVAKVVHHPRQFSEGFASFESLWRFAIHLQCHRSL